MRTTMVCLQYLAVQILLLCCCNIEALCDKNIFKFKIVAEEETVPYSVTVNLTTSLHECDAKYLSIAIGSSRVVNTWTGSDKLNNLASTLAPCDVQLGGTSANFLCLSPNGTGCRSAVQDQFSDKYDKFDSEFFNLTTTIDNFTMTEPNSYLGNFGFTMGPATLVKNNIILKSLLAKYPLYASSKLCGPDVTNVGTRGNARSYLRQFVACNDVMDEIGLHHYYASGETATAADFLSPVLMDSLKELFDLSLEIIRSYPHPRPIRLTETSSCYGGGANALSDRYIAGFLWIDKLGIAAKYGTTRVFRQALFGGAYALITSGLDPNPDYYLSVLFKRLIEGPIFNITVSPSNPNLRVYAHCARRGLYTAGALVVYYLNVGTTETVVSLPQFRNADLDLYLLTPGDASGLQSKLVKLNGQTLLMSGTALPAMPPLRHSGDVTVTAQSFGFIVVPRANVTLCVNYFATVDSRQDNSDE